MADAADAAGAPANTPRLTSPAGPPAGAQPPGRPTGPARTRPWHWAAVAAACAALVAAVTAAGPAVRPVAQGAPGTPLGTPKAVPAASAPDPAKAALPLDCGPLPATVSISFAADLGDGTPSTVAAAHCDAGSGTAPDGVFVLGAGADGTPAVRATLLDWKEGFTVTRLALRSDGTITASAQGYSTPDIPRCCPDLTVGLNWARHGDSYTRTESSAPSAKA